MFITGYCHSGRTKLHQYQKLKRWPSSKGFAGSNRIIITPLQNTIGKQQHVNAAVLRQMYNRNPINRGSLGDLVDNAFIFSQVLDIMGVCQLIIYKKNIRNEI